MGDFLSDLTGYYGAGGFGFRKKPKVPALVPSDVPAWAVPTSMMGPSSKMDERMPASGSLSPLRAALEARAAQMAASGAPAQPMPAPGPAMPVPPALTQDPPFMQNPTPVEKASPEIFGPDISLRPRQAPTVIPARPDLENDGAPPATPGLPRPKIGGAPAPSPSAPRSPGDAPSVTPGPQSFLNQSKGSITENGGLLGLAMKDGEITGKDVRSFLGSNAFSGGMKGVAMMAEGMGGGAKSVYAQPMPVDTSVGGNDTGALAALIADQKARKAALLAGKRIM